MRVVKGFGVERLQRGRLATEADSVYDRSMDQARAARQLHAAASTSCPTLGLVGILWYGGHQVLDGNLTVGDIVAANLYVLMMIWPLRMIGMLARAAAAVVGRGAGRINDVLVTDPAIEDVPARQAAARRSGRGALRAT